MRTSFALMALCVSMLLTPPGSATEIFLLADFNDKAIDQPIGTGGPELGEPVSIDLGPAGAVVRNAPMPTPCLQIVDESDCCAQSVRFEFLDDAEIAAGPVVIRLDLWIPSQESSRFSLGVRERGGLPTTSRRSGLPSGPSRSPMKTTIRGRSGPTQRTRSCPSASPST